VQRVFIDAETGSAAVSPFRDVDVLVVGAGAAGTMLALELARFGVDFLAVDRLPGPSPYSRAITVHARTLEILDRIDSELAKQFLETGVRCPGYVLHYLDEHGARRVIRPGLDFRRLPSRYPFLLLNGQAVTEKLLRDYLLERYGRAPQWGVRCSDVTVTEEHVLAQLQRADGSQEAIRCRYLVACDGASSMVRERLGLVREGGEVAGVVLQNLDVKLESFPDDRDWVHYCMGPGHFLMVAQLPSGYSRLLMSQPVANADPEATPLRVFGEILGRHFDGVGFGETLWHSRWQSQERLATRYRSGNVLLAGDAAHVHSTGGGQGMNCCLQDAHNLGWKLAMVLDGRCAPSLLDSYETERKPIGAQVIAAASSIHELFMAGRGNDPKVVVSMQETGRLADLVDRVSGLAYHYRSEDGPAHLAAGDRAPDAVLADGGRVFDHTRDTPFALILNLPEGVPTDPATRFVERLERRYGALLSGVVLQPAPAPYDALAETACASLVRPDGYLAVVCAVDDPKPLEDYLRTLVGDAAREPVGSA